MPQIVHTPTACGREPFLSTSGIVALQAASLVVMSVLCSMHAAVVFVVHVFGLVETLLLIAFELPKHPRVCELLF